VLSSIKNKIKNKKGGYQRRWKSILGIEGVSATAKTPKPNRRAKRHGTGAHVTLIVKSYHTTL